MELTPKQIVNELDRYIIGQYQAKKNKQQQYFPSLLTPSASANTSSVYSFASHVTNPCRKIMFFGSIILSVKKAENKINFIVMYA
jgi:hypothetical protein